MRQQACIPSGVQQWTTKTLAVGVDKFAVCSTLAVYVYSMESYMPLAILGQHDKHLTAVAMSPFEANLLACATGSQEVKVIDMDTEQQVRYIKFSAPKENVSTMQWHRGATSSLLLAVGSQLVCWDYGSGSGEGHWQVLKDARSTILAFDQAHHNHGLVAVSTADARVLVLDISPAKGSARTVREISLAGDGSPGSERSGGGAGAAAAAGGPACEVRWEPLSTSYVMVACRSGVMAMYDVTSGEQVSAFSKQPGNAARSVEFLPDQPGSFLVASSRSGALQLWNVSQPQPMKLFKLNLGLIQGVALLRPPLDAAATSAASAAANGVPQPGSHQPPKRCPVLVSFGDGGLMAYDTARQQQLWRQEGGHTETIFDCRFCTTDHNLLATCSFDSTIRVWDVRTARCVKHLGGAEGILYSVSWSADGRQLAVSNNSGTIFLFDYVRGMISKALSQHTKQALKVAFHPHRPNLLASASMDGTVFVYTTEGEVKRTLRHYSGVSCIAWGVLCPDYLATTCETGELHVWDISRPAAECLVKTLDGHTSRTFNVEFSPLLQYHLLSSSNDRTARVWQANMGICLAVLEGHTAEVRAVAWHPEIPHICFTGSWDSTIRVWDARDGKCLRVATDHCADVYGLACHPARPFLMASCSRDTTIRFWSTLELTPHLLPQALVRPISALRCTAEDGFKLSDPGAVAMAGPGSAALAERMATASVTPLEKYAAITQFFLPPAGLEMLWELAQAYRTSEANGGSARGQRSSCSGAPVLVGGGGGADDTIQHWSAAKLAVTSAANHLELAAGSNKTRSTGGGAKREELLRDAAWQHLMAGNPEHCCELLAELGDWDRALALAPCVGMEFWQRMVRQRAQMLVEAQATVVEVLPLYLAGGQVPELLELLVASGQNEMGFNVAAINASGAFANYAGAASAAAAGLVAGQGSFAAISSSGTGHEPGPASRVGHGSWSGLDPQTSSEWGPPRAPPANLPPLQVHERASTGTLQSAFSITSPTSSGGGALGMHQPAPPPLPLPPAASLPSVTSRAGALQPLTHLHPAPSVGGAVGSGGGARPGPPPVLLTGSGGSGGVAGPLLHSVTSCPSPTAYNALASPASASLLPMPPSFPSFPNEGPSQFSNGSPCHTTPLALDPQQPGSPTSPAPPPPAAPVPPPPPPVPPPTGSNRSDSPQPPTASLLPPAGPTAAPLPPRAYTTGGAAPASPLRSTPSTRRRSVVSTTGGAQHRQEALEQAAACRREQARMYLVRGLPLHAACCALSVDDLESAVGLLLRGHMEELAAAMVLALRPPGSSPHDAAPPGVSAGLLGGLPLASRPRCLLAVAVKCEAAGYPQSAAELLKAIGRVDLQQMLAGRCRAMMEGATGDASASAPPSAQLLQLYRSLGLQDPSSYGPQADRALSSAPLPDLPGGSSGAWDTVRLLLLAGRQEPAAERALAATKRLLQEGGRPRVLCGLPDWDFAWQAINSLWQPSLPKAAWQEVFAVAAYLGVCAAWDQGYLTVALYLVRVLSMWCSSGVPMPVPQQRLMDEVCEAMDGLMAQMGPGPEARAVLEELQAATPDTVPWLQAALRSRLGRISMAAQLQPSQRGMSVGSAGGAAMAAAAAAATDPHGLAPVPPAAMPGSGTSMSLRGRLGAGSSSLGGAAQGLGRFAGLDIGSLRGQAGGAAVLAPLASLTASASALLGGDTSPVGSVGSTLMRGGAGAAGGGCGGSLEVSKGPVIAASSNVPARPPGGVGALSIVTGGIIRGAVVSLDDGGVMVSLSEAVMLSRVMRYSPTGSGKLLRVA